MELEKAINERRSVRGYKKAPVSRETLEKVLEAGDAGDFRGEHAALGDRRPRRRNPCAIIAAANVQSFLAGEKPDLAESTFDGVYRRRRIGIGKKLFAAMDIAREGQRKTPLVEFQRVRLFRRSGRLHHIHGQESGAGEHL